MSYFLEVLRSATQFLLVKKKLSLYEPVYINLFLKKMFIYLILYWVVSFLNQTKTTYFATLMKSHFGMGALL